MTRAPQTRRRAIAASLRRLRTEESGLTLIEVVVSALLVVLIGGSFVALGAVQKTTGDQQRRTQATELAQQDQERMRGMSADQLSNLDRDERKVEVDGVVYRIYSSGQFINRSAGSQTCTPTSSTGADYIRTTSEVTWDSNTRSSVVINGLATPAAGGAVVTRVVDQNAQPISGAKVLATGASTSTLGTKRSATTDSSGCSIFPGMPVGDYGLSASLSGYVNSNGASPSSTTVTATTTGTAAQTFAIGRAGSITATFTTVVGGATLTGQQAPSIGWSNVGMATPRYVTPGALASSISTGTSLYPFTAGTDVYTNNYAVWAGSCSSAQPPTGTNRKFATVGPGVADPETVTMPGMDLEVRWKNGSASAVRVKPSAVKLTDSCGQSWYPAISSTASTSTTGVFTYPGQPYGTYTICAAYLSGSTSYRKIVTGVANTNFAGALTQMQIDSGTANQGTC